MRRLRLYVAVLAVLALGLCAALVPGTARADSPHFISGSSSISRAGALLCSFKEAGLGTVSAASITCQAQASATYYCVNGGGNHPRAANKEVVTQPVSTTESFPVRNGQTTGTITVQPPGPGSFSCPPGQQLVFGGVTYTAVQVVGEAGALPLADQSATFITF